VSFCRQNDYGPPVYSADVIVMAENQGVLCAAVRLCEEHGVLLLRGTRDCGCAEYRRDHGRDVVIMRRSGRA
jgi:hypothetical protein